MTARELMPGLLRATGVSVVCGVLLGMAIQFHGQAGVGSYSSFRTIVIVGLAAWFISWVAGRVAGVQSYLLVAPLAAALVAAGFTCSYVGAITPAALAQSTTQLTIALCVVAFFAATLLQIGQTRVL